MKNVFFVFCPSDACEEVKKIANYVCERKGGQGVIREVVKRIVEDEIQWNKIVNDIYLS